MDIVRRNTDYAIRLVLNLAKRHENGPVSTRTAASEEGVPYQLACKLMQRLHNEGLVESSMGPKGGFALSKKPAKINLLEIIETIQGPLSLNRCVLSEDACSRQNHCPVRVKLINLEEKISSSLASIKMDELLRINRAKKKTRQKVIIRRKK